MLIPSLEKKNDSNLNAEIYRCGLSVVIRTRQLWPLLSDLPNCFPAAQYERRETLFIHATKCLVGKVLAPTGSMEKIMDVLVRGPPSDAYVSTTIYRFFFLFLTSGSSMHMLHA